jgi:hypothetical protein
MTASVSIAPEKVLLAAMLPASWVAEIVMRLLPIDFDFGSRAAQALAPARAKPGHQTWA